MGSRFLRKTVTSTGKSGAFRAPEKPILAWFQFAAYPIGVVLAGLFVLHTSKISLRRDSERISNINTFYIT